jgi:ATP-dependent DNA ligase
MNPVKPFEPVSSNIIPAGPEWMHQIKWDGVRMLTYFDGQKVQLFNRRQHERTANYPELTDIKKYCSARSVVFDGEVVALGSDGKPSFHEVMRRDAVRHDGQMIQRIPVFYMIFDVLYYNGHWINDQPLRTRNELLATIVKPSDQVQIVSSHADGDALYGVIRQQNMEGIVSKKQDSRYPFDGKDARWQKIKYYRDLIAVIGGATRRQGSMNAVLLGLYNKQDQFVPIGNAGPGKLSAEEWHAVSRFIERIRTPHSPFVIQPETEWETMWIRPVVTVKVHFAGWTANRTLRQPVIQSVVLHAPEQCRFEVE